VILSLDMSFNIELLKTIFGAVNRRIFFKLSFLTATSWFFFGSTTWASPSNTIVGNLHQKLLNLLPHLESFQVIGERYLKLYPQEDDLNYLLISLNYELPGNSWYQWLQAKIKEDFQHKQTVQVEGWILSKTEAQLCALATRL